MSAIIAEKNEISAVQTSAFKGVTEDVATIIQKATTYEAPAGAKEAIGSISPDVYADLLTSRTSLTVAQVKELQELNTTVVAAVHLANGRAGLPIMKDNAAVNTVSLKLPMVGRDSFEVTLHRSKEVPAGNRENPAERKTKFGDSRGAFEIHAEGNRGELTKVKSFLNNEAASLFN